MEINERLDKVSKLFHDALDLLNEVNRQDKMNEDEDWKKKDRALRDGVMAYISQQPWEDTLGKYRKWLKSFCDGMATSLRPDKPLPACGQCGNDKCPNYNEYKSV